MDNQIENQEMNTRPAKDGGVGPVIGSVIIILLILIGGLYYLDSIRDKVQDNTATEESRESEESSEDVGSLEDDLESIDLEELNSDLDDIDAEIDASLQ